MERKVLGPGAGSCGQGSREIPRRQGRYNGSGAHAAASSDREALASLGAACIEHRLAAAGLHAGAKPMRAGTADLGRLIRAFHDGSLGLAQFYMSIDRCTRPTLLAKAAAEASRLGEKPVILTNSAGPANGLVQGTGKWVFPESETNCG